MRYPGITALETLLSPSWLSGILDVIAWLAIMLGALVSQHFSGSIIQQAVFNIGNTSGTTYRQVTDNVSNNRLISNLPLFIFWLGVGLIVYYFAVSIYGAITHTVELREELDYVNVQRHKLVLTAFEHLAVRALALIAWIIYLTLFFKHLVPYVLTSVQATTTLSLHTIEVAVWAALLLAIGLHVHTIFLRLVLLRQRVFN